jgi:hypothetical protein
VIGLDAGWLERGPLVIGATGGSGTRVVARMARAAGVFLGDRLNESEDPWDLIDLYDRHLNAWLADPVAREPALVEDLGGLLRDHLAPLPAPAPWGWKEPRSLYVLPLLARAFPALRVVHVVRDGRDMAFSSNQNQLRKHGAALLGDRADAVTPDRSLALWTAVNARAAQACAALGDRYLVVRFEDLCHQPVVEAERLLEFLGTGGDARAVADLVEDPGSLARWRTADPATLRRLDAIGGDALARFGYA